MFEYLNEFAGDESGAITVDWVVLTAAVIGLALALMGTVQSQVGNLAADLGGDMATRINNNTSQIAANTYSE